MSTYLSIVAMVFSIAASIASIVANCRLRRVERMLKVTTHGANSPVYIYDTAGGKLNAISISESSVTIVQANSVTLQPPITAPSTDTSPLA
jgi:hypothetical protein